MAQWYSTVASNAIVQGSILGISIFCSFFLHKTSVFISCYVFSSKILSEGQRPCLERLSRRSLGLPRAEGPG